jgi:hypothetical protein
MVSRLQEQQLTKSSVVSSNDHQDSAEYQVVGDMEACAHVAQLIGVSVGDILVTQHNKSKIFLAISGMVYLNSTARTKFQKVDLGRMSTAVLSGPKGPAEISKAASNAVAWENIVVRFPFVCSCLIFVLAPYLRDESSGLNCLFSSCCFAFIVFTIAQMALNRVPAGARGRR